MRKKYFSPLLLTLIFFLFVGCKSTILNNDDSKESEYYSYYTGEKSLENVNTNIPFMAIIENSQAARPQCGLSEADIIYEASAEGGIPRFLALFHKNSPNVIGPIRSVRPYFIDISMFNGLPFAHCGGSQESLNEISNNSNIMSINEVYNGSYFWRDNNRKAPHNLYTSSNNIRDYILKHNWTVNPEPFMNFDDSFFESQNLNNVTSLTINMNRYYSTNYIYNNNIYTKYMDGNIATDDNNNEPLSFSNIVIQKTEIKLGSDNEHLNINLIGSGNAFILSKGKIIDVTWQCSANNSKTKLYDSLGNEVSLSPGKTIWHIIDKETSIKFN